MKTLFENTYDGESIVDASRDFSEALPAEFNPAVAELPVDHMVVDHMVSYMVSSKWLSNGVKKKKLYSDLI